MATAAAAAGLSSERAAREARPPTAVPARVPAAAYAIYIPYVVNVRLDTVARRLHPMRGVTCSCEAGAGGASDRWTKLHILRTPHSLNEWGLCLWKVCGAGCAVQEGGRAVRNGARSHRGGARRAMCCAAVLPDSHAATTTEAVGKLSLGARHTARRRLWRAGCEGAGGCRGRWSRARWCSARCGRRLRCSSVRNVRGGAWPWLWAAHPKEAMEERVPRQLGKLPSVTVRRLFVLFT